jgi:hypothetical protein
MATIRPKPRATMPSATAWAVLATLMKLRSNMRRNNCSPDLPKGALSTPPALAIKDIDRALPVLRDGDCRAALDLVGYVGGDIVQSRTVIDRGPERVFVSAQNRDFRACAGQCGGDRPADPAAAAADQRVTACEICHRASPAQFLV